MSIKLSELLEAGAEALYAAGQAAEDLELFDHVKPYKDKASAFRAIVPALVRAVTEVCERHRNEDGESLHPVNGCAVCALAITLEEAGVTCD